MAARSRSRSRGWINKEEKRESADKSAAAEGERKGFDDAGRKPGEVGTSLICCQAWSGC